jgi:hypothetical protein
MTSTSPTYHVDALSQVRPGSFLIGEDMLTTDFSQLKNQSLFIRDAFINGEWVSKEATFDVYGESSRPQHFTPRRRLTGNGRTVVGHGTGPSRQLLPRRLPSRH